MPAKNILVANIGLGNAKKNANCSNRVQTRARVHDTLLRATNEVGPVTLMAIQELGDLDFMPAPFFGKTVTDDAHLLQEADSKARGVGIFANSNCYEVIDNTGWKDEIVAVSDFYPGRNGTRKKFGLINVYRLTHKDQKRTVEETTEKVKEIIKTFRTKNISKIVICGDFNAEGYLNFGGTFVEITHEKLFHKHNHSSRKTKIDRVFSNFPNETRIEAVFDSIEAINKDQESSELGHKPYIIQIGRKDIPKEVSKAEIVSIRNLKKVSKEPVKFLEFDTAKARQKSMWEQKDICEKMASDFTRRVQDALDSARTKIKRSGQKSLDHVLISEIERAETAIDSGKKQDKMMYKFARNIKNGIDEKIAGHQEGCSLKDKSAKLQDKLNNLNPTDLKLGLEMVKEIYDQKGVAVEAAWAGNMKNFKSLILSTSNSGALDCFGMSLKMTKTLLRKTSWTRRLREILELCLECGYFPAIWRQDEISFLYKGGCRKEGSNYRPITIAPSLGKHFERVIAEMMRPMDDRNYDNHAYKSRRSCLTAIVDLQKKLTYARLLSSDKDPKKYKCLSLISPDDIAGAFESIDHVLVSKALEYLFAKERRARLPDVILSYLDRKSSLIDRDTGEKIELIKKFIRKTSPQGSILSPILWRVYDNIFTHLYKNNLKVLQEEHEDIIAISHVSYADDHITVVTFWVLVEFTNDQTARRSSELLFSVRCLIADATRQMGCGVNPIKSENIVPKKYAHMVDVNFDKVTPPADKPNVFKGKFKFKWLGYFLKLRENHTIEFCEDEIEKRLNQIHAFRAQIFQYTNNMRIKWRVYQTFISPFVELYTPFVAQSNIHKITCVHKLQHRSICEALGIPTTANRDRVEEKVGERSVQEKTKRMACRVIQAMNLERPHQTKFLTRATRNNKTALLYSHDPDDRMDFTHRLDFYANLEVKQTSKVKIDFKNIKNWANIVNSSIKEKIAQKSQK